MPNVTRSVIGSSRLYFQDHISGSPFTVAVQPGDMCAATSRAYKPGLSLATAGRAAYFTVQVLHAHAPTHARTRTRAHTHARAHTHDQILSSSILFMHAHIRLELSA